MTKTQIKKTVRKLSQTDRINMLDELVLSMASDQPPVTESQKAMIDECLDEIEKFPGRGMSHAEFRKKIQETKAGLRPSNRRKSA